MKTPSLSGSIARGLVIAKAFAVGSLGLLLAGCATPEDNALLGVALGAVAPYARTAQSAASAATLGQALTTFGSAQASAPRIQTEAKAKLLAESDAKKQAIHRSNLSAKDKAMALAHNAAWTKASLKAAEAREAQREREGGKSVGEGVSSPVNTPTGVVTISASEDVAEVYLGMDFVGNVPSKLTLPRGKHLIEVRKEGFKPFKKEILITQGAELTLKVKLEKE